MRSSLPMGATVSTVRRGRLVKGHDAVCCRPGLVGVEGGLHGGGKPARGRRDREGCGSYPGKERVKAFQAEDPAQAKAGREAGRRAGNGKCRMSESQAGRGRLLTRRAFLHMLSPWGCARRPGAWADGMEEGTRASRLGHAATAS